MYSTAKTISGLVDHVARRSPSRPALNSPFQNHKFTYGELSETTQALAGWLSMYGFEKNDLLVSDLPNTSENLMVQLACNRLGVCYTTVKDLEGMAKFPKVKGSISSENGFLATTTLPLPTLSGEFLEDLIHEGGLANFSQEIADAGDISATHAYYNSTSPFTNEQALTLGEDAAFQLAVHEEDVVCISITLCHAFGMGSAVSSALMLGATIVLPAVGGIRGCGVPSERAAATLDILQQEKCTLLFADTHTLKALPEPPHDLSLRGGVCKVGSGSDFLAETKMYGGAKLMTLGKQ